MQDVSQKNYFTKQQFQENYKKINKIQVGRDKIDNFNGLNA